MPVRRHRDEVALLAFGRLENLCRWITQREVRGEHAHKRLHELLICLKGSCAVMVDDGTYRDEVVLDSPTTALHVPPGLWRVHYKYSPDAILLSLCSDPYDANDYIRDYNDFLKLNPK